MSEEDKELEMLKAKRLAEMQKNLSTQNQSDENINEENENSVATKQVRMVKKTITYIPGLYKIFDEIIVNSYEFKKRIKKIFNLNSQVIYNPISLPKKINKKKIKFFNNYKHLKILTIGRLTDQKDYLTLIKSLNLLKKEGYKFKLYWIGRGYNNNINQNVNFIIVYIKTNQIAWLKMQ